MGRFLETDPIGYADGLNWYAYVGNGPVNARDPSGLLAIQHDEGNGVPGGDSPWGGRDWLRDLGVPLFSKESSTSWTPEGTVKTTWETVAENQFVATGSFEWSFTIGVGVTAAFGLGGGGGVDISVTGAISSSGVSVGLQGTVMDNVYGGFMGFGGQVGVGVGNPIFEGPSGPAKSDWIGGSAGWGATVGGSGNFGGEGINVGRGVGGVGFGGFYGEGKSIGGSWGWKP